ncbi:MAG: hypothetical protein ABL879_13950 [Devosia sp.]
MKSILPFATATALVIGSLAVATPTQAAYPIVTATSGASIYTQPYGKGRQVGRVPRGTEVSIDYCLPPRAAYCHIIWEGASGWVNGANLSSPGKKRLVTPFVPFSKL